MADQPPPRRRFQFSLRLALLLMSLACVVASWIGWRLYTARLDSKSNEFPLHVYVAPP